MAGTQRKITYSINFQTNTAQLEALKNSLKSIRDLTVKDIMKIDNSSFSEAKQTLNDTRIMASKVEDALAGAFNYKLNTVNVKEFNNQLQSMNLDLTQVQNQFSKVGAVGTQNFIRMTDSILETNLQVKQTAGFIEKAVTTLKNTLTWNISSSIVNKLTGSIQEAYGYVKNLDTSLNDIRIVTGASADEMDKFAEKANKAATALGKSTTDYTEASLIYYQQGLSDEEVEARTNITLKAANVTGQSTEEVSEQLTAVWNGYNASAEEAELYVDRLAAVAAATASDLEELSTGMSKVASAAAALGVGEEQLAAQLSTIISVTRQAPESVGTALKTIYARMSDIQAGADEEGATLGSYTAEMAEMGVNVLDATGSLRDMGGVIEEIGGKWSTFSREQQIALAQTMAGTRQYNNLIALFDNWDSYIDTLKIAQDAQGTLQEQQDIYMESTAAHLEQLNAATEGIFDSLLNAESINSVADVFTKIANGIEVIIDSAGGGLGILSQFSGAFLNMFSANVGEFFAKTQQGMAIEISNRNQLNEKLEYSKKLMESLQNTQTKNSLEKTNIQGHQAILSFGNSGASAEEVGALTEQYKKYMETATQAGIAQETLANSTKLVNQNFVESVSNLKAENAARDSIIEVTEKVSAKTLLSADSFETFKEEIKSTGLTTTDFNNKLDEQSNLFIQLEQKIESAKKTENEYKTAEEQLAVAQGELNKLKTQFNQIPTNTAEITTYEEAVKALEKYKNSTKASAEEINKLTAALADYKAAEDLVNEARSAADQKKTAYTAEQKALAEVNEQIRNNAHYIFSSVDAVKILNNDYDDLKELGKKNVAQAEQMAATFKSIGTQNFFSGIYTSILAVGQGISTITNLSKQLKSIWDNEDLSYWEKLGQTVSLASSSLMSLGFTFNMAQQASAKFGTTSKANTASLAIEEGAREALKDKVNQETVAEGVNQIATEASSKSSKENAAANLAEAAAEGASKAATDADSVAKTVNKGVTEKLTLAQLALNFAAKAFPYVAIAAGIAVIVGAIITLTDKVKNAEKALDKAKKKTEESKQALDDLTSSWENLNNSKNNLDNLTKGTLEWKEALIETNNQVMELIEKFPELAKGVQIDASGLMTIDEEVYEDFLEDQINNVQDNIIRQQKSQAYLAEVEAENVRKGKTFKKFEEKYGQEDLDVIIKAYSQQGAAALSKESLQNLGITDIKEIAYINENFEDFYEGLNTLSNSIILSRQAADQLNLDFINSSEKYKEYDDQIKRQMASLLGSDIEEIQTLTVYEATGVELPGYREGITAYNNAVNQQRNALKDLIASKTGEEVEGYLSPQELLEQYKEVLLEEAITEVNDLAETFTNNINLADLYEGRLDASLLNEEDLKTLKEDFNNLTEDQKKRLETIYGYSEEQIYQMIEIAEQTAIIEANKIKDSSITPVREILTDIIPEDEISKYSTEVLSGLQTQLTEIWSGLGQESSQTFANLFKQIPVDQTDEFLAVWDNFDWSTGDVEQFTNLLKEQGVVLKEDTINDFEALGLQMEEASKKSQTLKFSLEGISKAGKIAEKTSVGDVISDNDYAELLSVNSEISKFFEKTIDGYKYLGSNSGKSLSQLVTNIDQVKERTKELSKEVKELQNEGFTGKESFNLTTWSFNTTGFRGEIEKLRNSTLLKDLGKTEQLEDAINGISKLKKETENFTDISQEQQEQLDTYKETIISIYTLASKYAEDYGSEAKANYQAEKIWIDLNIKSLNDLYKAWNQGIINNVQAYNEAKEYQLNLMRQELGLSDELIAKYAEMHTGGDEQAAVQLLNAQKTAKEFYENREQYISGLSKNTNSIEYLQTIEDIQNAMETILGGSISEEFVENKENVEEFINALGKGGEALEKFQEKALIKRQNVKDIIKNLNISEEDLKVEIKDNNGKLLDIDDKELYADNTINLTTTIKGALDGDKESLTLLYWWAQATGNQQLISALGIERIATTIHIGNTTYTSYTFELKADADVSEMTELETATDRVEESTKTLNREIEIENSKYEDLGKQIDVVNRKLEKLQKIQSNLKGEALKENLRQQEEQYQELSNLYKKQASSQKTMAGHYLSQAQKIGQEINLTITDNSSLEDIVNRLEDLKGEDLALGEQALDYFKSYEDALDEATSLNEESADVLDELIDIQKAYIDVIKESINSQTSYQDYRTGELQEEIDKNEAKAETVSSEESEKLALENYELSKQQTKAAKDAMDIRNNDLEEYIDGLLKDEDLDEDSKSLISKYFSKDSFDSETGELTKEAYDAIQQAIKDGEDKNGVLQSALEGYLELDDQRDQSIIDYYKARAQEREAANQVIAAETSKFETDTVDEEARLAQIQNELEQPFSNESQIERNELLKEELEIRKNILKQKQDDLKQFTDPEGELRKLLVGENEKGAYDLYDLIKFDESGAITNLEALEDLYKAYPALEAYVTSYQAALEDVTEAEKADADTINEVSEAMQAQSQEDIQRQRHIEDLNKELKELQENDSKLTGTALIQNIDLEIEKIREIIAEQNALLNSQKNSFNNLTEIFEESEALQGAAIDWAGDWETQLMELAAKAIAAGDSATAQTIYNILNALRAASDQIKETEENLDSLNDSLEDFEDKKLSIELEVDESSYHSLDITLKSIERELNAVQKASKGLTGQDLINNLNRQEQIIRKQIAAYQQKLKLMQIELLRLQQILALQGVAFNADGTVSNYAEIFASGNKDLLSYIQTYENYQEKILELQDTINDSYYNITDLEAQKAEAIAEAAEEAAEKAEEEMNKRLEEFNAKVDVELDIADAKREWNRFKKEFLDGLKDSDIFGNAKADLEDFISYSETDIPLLTDHLNDIMSEISIMQTGGTSELYGTDQSTAFDDLANYRDQLISSMQSLQDLIESIESAYLEQIGKIQSKFDDQIDTFEQITSIIEHNMNIIKLLKGDDSYKELAKYYEKQEKNYNAELQQLREQVEYWKTKMESAEVGSDEWETYQKNWKSAVASLNETVEAAIQNIIDKYTNTINEIFDKLEKKVTGGLGLDYISDEWDLINQNADFYLDKINAAYEIQTLQNKYLQAIEDSDSLTTQQKLNAAMEEELKKLREKDKLTQYDIDRANAMYEVTMKQIALEEAQKNKTSMRLRRDSEGNYRYEYVSDEDEIAQKQQELLDAQNQLYNIDKEAYKNNLDEMLNIYQAFQNELYELYADQTLTEEEREQRKQMLVEQYESLINGIIAENEVIKQNLQESTFMNLASLYDKDIEALKNMTDAEKDVLMSDLIPQWDTAIQKMIDKFAADGGLVPECSDAFSELEDATLDYENSLQQIEEAAGISFEDIISGIDDTIGEMEDLIEINDGLLEKYEEELNAIADLIENLHDLMDTYRDVYDAAIQAVDAALELREAAIEALEAFKELNDAVAAASSSGGTTTSGGSSSKKKKQYLVNHETGEVIQLDNLQDNTEAGYKENSYTTNAGNNFVVKKDGEEYHSSDGYFITSDEEIANDIASGNLEYEDVAPGAGLDEDEKKKKKAAGYATGGYTGEWGPEGKLAILHEKELVLNKDDTENMLKMMEIAKNNLEDYSSKNSVPIVISNSISPDILDKILYTIGQGLSAIVAANEARTDSQVSSINQIASSTNNNYTNTSDVNINANFPSATSAKEIENAFNNLRNVASQRANKSSRF